MKERYAVMMKAPVNKIIHNSLVDGTGNRCVIFFQGCNIACKYCHNPETQNFCSNCGICIPQCPHGALYKENETVIWDSEKCEECDCCIIACTNNSSPRVRYLTVDEVMGEVKKNIPFIRGITVSGGECSLYLPFVYDLFTECRKIGLTCFLDTNGTLPLNEKNILEVCDGVMLDIKSWDKSIFRDLTGSNNNIVKENLSILAKQNRLEEIRIVCILPFVDAETVIKESAGYLPEEIRKKVLLKLIRFRNLGVRGEWSNYSSPNNDYMQELKEQAVLNGYHNVRIM